MADTAAAWAICIKDWPSRQTRLRRKTRSPARKSGALCFSMDIYELRLGLIMDHVIGLGLEEQKAFIEQAVSSTVGIVNLKEDVDEKQRIVPKG